MSFCLIILAGGNSHRFKSNIGKPYQKIAGKSLIEISVNKARQFKQIKKIIIVYNKKDLKRVKSLKLRNVKLISGGNNRQKSTYNALKFLNNKKGISKVLMGPFGSSHWPMTPERRAFVPWMLSSTELLMLSSSLRTAWSTCSKLGAMYQS